MLHKKSEYKQQYCKLNQDLRRKIWQDNVALRKSRLVSNQATHYWEYQLSDDPCDCETGDYDDEDDDNTGPVPPHRQKHRELQEQYNQQMCKSQIKPLNLISKDAREIAVQTPEWNGDEPDKRLDPSSDEELLKHINTLTLPEAKDIHCQPPSSVPPKVTPGSLSRPRTARSLSRPSRTTRKLVTEPKQTHFVPFGWNEKTTKVGQKQTFNICAPEKEVHASALNASQRRKAEVEEFVTETKNVKHHARSRERVNSNTSSTWMSEYQDQFSARGSRMSRPLSAPPAPRKPVSWRHS